MLYGKKHEIGPRIFVPKDQLISIDQRTSQTYVESGSISTTGGPIPALRNIWYGTQIELSVTHTGKIDRLRFHAREIAAWHRLDEQPDATDQGMVPVYDDYIYTNTESINSRKCILFLPPVAGKPDNHAAQKVPLSHSSVWRVMLISAR